ncbi:Rossmann-like and DUF2520 domain-containing protein [Undibacterium pigrum]|uniref:Putative short-subunit dehydrogenase-like oxidoreductase (DUF2520 family) n=1 Tax=Undibacterium pigrum TaxID=401470 RepID=A0A318IU91_9BURK|nr:Rossmann-like and DUF2520 domain-containing protein [Undibacterium pigrum]PXX38764.1 putative short-subunit dehydrogenase-like oxidoreductase (DUF2520 family) [Undibacterium pigrum]
MKTLNIIGVGKVGKVLAKNFLRQQQFAIQQVLNRSMASASTAVAWLGAGRAVDAIAQLQPADVTMLTVSDDQITSVCQQLADAGLLKDGSVIFHCSGAKASTELQAARMAGATVASVHPVRSFANVDLLAEQFVGTICSLEGDEAALAVLVPALQAIGAETVIIQAENKLLYHAGSVFASNYLVTLMEVALRTYQAAGIPAEVAQKMAAPLARQTLENVFALGTQAALTGPIARGDMQTVVLQQSRLSEWDQQAGDLYRVFTQPTVDLAAARISDSHSEK